MEKLKEQNEKQSAGGGKATVWDCGSSLYDSFELKSFEHQLDSAISSARSLSMPHLTDDHRRQAPPTQPPQAKPSKKYSSKISGSLHKLIRSFFRPKQNSHSIQLVPRNGVYDRYGALTTIPEVPENMGGDYDRAGLSPKVGSFVGRSASDRFTAASIGISCA